MASVRAAAAGEAAGVSDLHSAALVHLIAEERSLAASEHAVAKLETARSLASPSVDLLTDLAAAYLVRAQRSEDPRDLVRSLDTVEEALALSPQNPVALFNRALALSYLALRRQAMEAWREYLLLELEPSWATEAKYRLEQLRAPTLADDWPDRESELRRGLVAGTALRLEIIIDDHPQQVRQYIEEEALGAWGEATEKGELPVASRLLANVDAASRQLARRQGDELLVDAVALLHTAAATDLAVAHRLYRDGRRLYANFYYREADSAFARSAAIFALHQSPFGFWPRYYRAVIVHHQPDFDQSLSLLRDLDTVPEFGYPIADAFTAWMIGLSLLRTGHFDPAHEEFLRARDLFASAGEVENGAAMDVQLAWIAEIVGERGESWRFRYQALSKLDQTVKHRRILNCLSAAARQLTAEEYHRVALYFHSEHAEAADLSGDPVSIALARSERADALIQLDRFADAATDLDLAERTIASIPHDGVRRDTAAEVALVRGRYLAAKKPSSALALLEDVGEFGRRYGEGRMLIEHHRIRARSFKELGNSNGAERELYSALEEIERQRARLQNPEERRGYLDQARSIAEELVSYLFDQAKIQAAFEVYERTRAPILREDLSWRADAGSARSLEQMQEHLAPDDAIVSYLVLDERVLGWVLKDDRLAPFELLISATEVDAVIAAWVEALQSARSEAPLPRPSAVLLPTDESLWRGVKRVVVVPDGPLFSLPYGALPDPEGYGLLIENRAVSIVPSANFYLDLIRKSHAGTERDPESILVVTDVPSSPKYPALESVKSAASLSSLGDLFRVVTVLRGGAATENRLLAELPRHDVVAFIGHAVAAEARAASRPGLILAQDGTGGGDGWLTPDEIRFAGEVQTRVVILAGCSTAAGEPSSTEGTLGFARPLLAAGARSVIITLWPISAREATSLLVPLSRSLSRSEPFALRRTQLERLEGLRRSTSGNHAWAGWVVWGEPL